MSQEYDIGDAPFVEGYFGTNVTDQVLSSATGATTITVRDVTGYSIGSAVVVDANKPNAEFRTVSNVSGMVVTFSSALHLPHSVVLDGGKYAYPQLWKLADPTAVTLEVKSPAEEDLTEYQYPGDDITKTSTGRYTRQLTLDAAGKWRFGYIGTGDVIAAGQGSFEVRPWRVA